MSAKFFDSNVFVYLFDDVDRKKRKTAETLIGRAIESGDGVISFQVVQETLNVITRKLAKPASADDARRFLDRVLVPLWRVMPNAELYHRAFGIQARYRYAFFDSVIIAAALEADCTRLYSEDFQDGQRIEGLTIENPFKR